jgi:hypothetical protein
MLKHKKINDGNNLKIEKVTIMWRVVTKVVINLDRGEVG